MKEIDEKKEQERANERTNERKVEWEKMKMKRNNHSHPQHTHLRDIMFNKEKEKRAKSRCVTKRKTYFTCLLNST